MSFSYWDMKLTGGYVHYQGEIEMIESLSFDDDRWENERPKGSFPEDYLPFITFNLSGGDNVQYEDFEIKFPDDQWYFTKGKKASNLSRKMTRQYKIAPTRELYETTHEEPLSVVLAKCDSMEYNAPTDMFNWEQQDKVFSPKISLVRTGHTKRTLFYNTTPIAHMTRGKDWIALTKCVGHLPQQCTDWWGMSMDKRIPSPVDSSQPADADFTGMIYPWQKYEDRTAIAISTHGYVVYRTAVPPHILFIMSTRLIAAARVEDIVMAHFEGNCTRNEHRDMTSIFEQEMGDIE